MLGNPTTAHPHSIHGSRQARCPRPLRGTTQLPPVPAAALSGCHGRALSLAAASPIWAILRGRANAEVLLAKVVDVDTERREVVLEERRVPYDFLIVTTGRGTPISAMMNGSGSRQG
jgi:hypothetical protein